MILPRLRCEWVLFVLVVFVLSALVIWLSIINVSPHWGWADDSLYQRNSLELVQDGAYASKFVPPVYPVYLAVVATVLGDTPKALALSNVPLFVCAVLTITGFSWHVTRRVWSSLLPLFTLAGPGALWLAWTNYAEPLTLILTYTGLGLASAAFTATVLSRYSRQDMDVAESDRGIRTVRYAKATPHGSALYRDNVAAIWLLSSASMVLLVTSVLTRTANIPFMLATTVVFFLLATRDVHRKGQRRYSPFFITPVAAAISLLLFYYLSGGTGLVVYLEAKANQLGTVPDQVSLIGATSQRLLSNSIELLWCVLHLFSPNNSAMVAPLLLTMTSLVGTWMCVSTALELFGGKISINWERDPLHRLRICGIVPITCLIAYLAFLAIAGYPNSYSRYLLMVNPILVLVFGVGLLALSRRSRFFSLFIALCAADLLILLLWHLSNPERAVLRQLLALVLVYCIPLLLVVRNKREIPCGLTVASTLLISLFVANSVHFYAAGWTARPEQEELLAVAKWLDENETKPVVVESKKPGFLYLASNGKAVSSNVGAIDLTGDAFLAAVKANETTYVIIDSIKYQPHSRKNWAPVIKRNPETFRLILIFGETRVYHVVDSMESPGTLDHKTLCMPS